MFQASISQASEDSFVASTSWARRQTSHSGGRDMSAALGWQHKGIEVDQCTQNPKRFIKRPTEQYLNGM
jgi:hypothetical protein